MRYSPRLALTSFQIAELMFRVKQLEDKMALQSKPFHQQYPSAHYYASVHTGGTMLGIRL